MILTEVLREGGAALRAAGIEGAARDARLLMAAALGCPADRLTLCERDPVDAAAAARFRAMVAARASRRPLSQVIGRRLFWGRSFGVTSDVLDPRPETETLVAAALAGGPARRVLDLGTGSGAILLTLLCEWPEAEGVGTDLAEPALAVAAGNAAALGVGKRAHFVRADWTAGLDGRFDLVVCNPPYIPAGVVPTLAPEVRDWEPRAALTAGPTGLEAYQRLAEELPGVLEPGARALLEFGEGQAEAVGAVFRAVACGAITFHRDLDGRERIIEIRAGEPA